MTVRDSNRRSWEIASQKYVDESIDFEALAVEGTLLPIELQLLAPIAAESVVVHVQSGNGTDDIDLARLGAATVIGVDFSATAARSAQGRSRTLETPVHYAVGDALAVPLRDGSVDLVYTGKGAIMWLPDLNAWASEIARLLRPGGHLFLYEAHPAAPLWNLDADEPVTVRPDRNYFDGTRVNDTFPASAIERFSPDRSHVAVEWQWSIADIVSTLLDAGLELLHLGEYPEPFWRPAGDSAVCAWSGRLPNSLSILARLRPIDS